MVVVRSVCWFDHARGPEARHSSTKGAEQIWQKIHGNEKASLLTCTDWDEFHRADVVIGPNRSTNQKTISWGVLVR